MAIFHLTPFCSINMKRVWTSFGKARDSTPNFHVNPSITSVPIVISLSHTLEYKPNDSIITSFVGDMICYLFEGNMTQLLPALASFPDTIPMYLLYFGDIPNLVSCAFSTIPIFPPFNSQNFLFTCLCSFLHALQY